MTRMLIATDGSKYGSRAADYGVRLAAKIGADVIGVYVVNLKSLEIYALEHHDDISGYEAENARLGREGEEALAYITGRCAEAGVKASATVIRGYPAEDIVRFAEKEQIDMIVVGSLGKSSIEYMFIGSVSESIVRKAPCPVLVVRGDARL